MTGYTSTSSSYKMRNEKSKESGLHRIQEVELENVDLNDDYEVERTLGEGCFAKILLATHRKTSTTVVLKAVHTEMSTIKDFYREFHYSYHLSPHPNILSSYPVAFQSEGCYIFAQEYAQLGDLAGVVRAGGIPEESCKKVAQQLCSALEFLHSKQLVHRDIKLENILVFAGDLSKVKLCDFGETRKEGCLVNKVRGTWHPFLPPEVCETVKNERFTCRPASDCWQVGIVLFVCLTGCPPWHSADLTSDTDYSNFSKWQKRRTTKIPSQFRKFTPRLLRMFRRLMEHKPEKRASITEVYKYLKDSWLLEKNSSGSPVERKDSTNLYIDHDDDDDDEDAHHINDENKVRLTKLLSSYGLETTLDQKAMTSRIWEWVLACESNADTNLEGI
ncbi:serine/threonine-protein kinase meng-po [Nilaparvata lugens]|uniref:serine/threonine-protein kinase meng-po n=1 Tax=Nilaparvata lugens TaxID=108931 RepID=UPI000B99690D|nr:serine/threonine-protein kinase meng-po [Nilaparvata lugens]